MEKIKEELGGQTEFPFFKHEAECIKSKKEVIVKTNTLVFRGENPKIDETKPIFYVIYYPIVYENKLIGILNIILKEEPKTFVVKNYFMHSICQQIAIMLGTQNLCHKLQIESEQRITIKDELLKLVNIVTDIIVGIDDNGYFKKINEGGKQVLGWSKEEFLKMRWQDLVHSDDYEATNEVRKKWKESSKQEPCINRYLCRDGSYKWLRWDGYYKKKEGDYVATAKDITHEVELETQEKLAKDILQVEKLRSEFFANLSHEFKTPITIIMSALQMLELAMKDELDGQVKSAKYIGTIKQNSYRLLRLVNNLIDTTKIDTGFYDVKIQNHNIIQVIEEIVLSVAEYAKDEEVEIIFDTDTEEEIMACDPEKIERIMLNLLSNAIKYTFEAGKIQVHVTVEKKELLISVQDNGIGISEEKLPYIFERFVQVNDVLTRYCEGSGIGLYLVKSLVELLAGRIDVSSTLGEGTRFDVRLPRIREDEEVVIESIEDTQAHERRIKKCHIEFSDIYKL